MCDGNCEAWNGQEEEEDVTGWSWTGEGRSACVWEEEGGGRLEERGEIISYEESAGERGGGGGGGGGGGAGRGGRGSNGFGCCLD